MQNNPIRRGWNGLVVRIDPLKGESAKKAEARTLAMLEKAEREGFIRIRGRYDHRRVWVNWKLFPAGVNLDDTLEAAQILIALELLRKADIGSGGLVILDRHTLDQANPVRGYVFGRDSNGRRIARAFRRRLLESDRFVTFDLRQGEGLDPNENRQLRRRLRNVRRSRSRRRSD